MANTTEKNAPVVDKRVKPLIIACCVLLLAVIVVSAFAYVWKTEIADLKTQNMSLRALADPTTINSMSEEIGNLTYQNNMLMNEIENYKNTIAEYEAILIENDLLPQ